MKISASDCNMGIYDNKVSYLTLEPGKEMAIIIEDKEISALQRHLFEELYNHATPLHSTATGSDTAFA